jgi:hypothetical protein
VYLGALKVMEVARLGLGRGAMAMAVGVAQGKKVWHDHRP